MDIAQEVRHVPLDSISLTKNANLVLHTVKAVNLKTLVINVLMGSKFRKHHMEANLSVSVQKFAEMVKDLSLIVMTETKETLMGAMLNVK